MKAKEFQFQIEFVTPLLIHGSNSGEADTLGLTGKALRGCWRFWFRSMVGGMVHGLKYLRLLELENSVFGSADEKTGAKFRLVAFPSDELLVNTEIQTGFDKGVRFSGYDPPSNFHVKILPRPSMTDDEILVLKATIWLWGSLGAVGMRERRGFGSPVIRKSGEEDVFADIGIRTQLDFESSKELVECLNKGLKQIWSTYKQWLEKQGEEINGDIFSNPVPSSENFFLLRSIHQIYTGKLFNDMNKAIESIHGNHNCDALGYAHGSRRMASPIFTRLWKFGDNYVPVAVFCPQKNREQQCNTHSDCVQAYLTSWGAIAI
ncbi:MAG: type III-B CRISPR module RAMP protein Cmr1 [Archaeoglobales archaeon]|nr:type III-B CRISPR module RAMP protein Cmr1 [Archaeoglobales archaeon]